MTAHQPSPLPPDLPVPEDDGAADHLRGARVTPLRLPGSDGREVVLGRPSARTLLFCYPRMGGPAGPPLVPHWDRIPGARGCTAEACGFRDRHDELAAVGVELYGVSTQELAAQRAAAGRLALPYPLLSDPGLALAARWRLPTFQVAGRTLLRRLTLLLEGDIVQRVWYPVFPPDGHAAEVLRAITA